MNKPTSQKLDDDLVTADEVAEHLRSHPDFFTHHPALLEHLRIPHHVVGAVSLVERQIRVLRKKNHALEQKLLSLVKTAKANEVLSSRMHNLSLALIQADNLDDVLACAQEQLIQAFNADTVTIQLFDTPALKQSGLHKADKKNTLELFGRAYENHRPLCGRLEESQLKFLFGDEAKDIGSAVFVPLATTEPIGYLALGSRDNNRFTPGMGTLFLGYLGELLTQAVSTQIARESR
ncbi:MAG: DUF484 family protein [bacterium]